MKIAISSQGNDLDSQIEQRFGRAQQFLLVDSDSGEYEVIDNLGNTELMSGAGIQTAEVIINRGAKAVITGHCGPKAFRTLNAAGMIIYTGSEGSVKEILAKFKNNELKPLQSPDVQGHW